MWLKLSAKPHGGAKVAKTNRKLQLSLEFRDMKRDEKKKLFENVVRLRQAERESPGNRYIGAVRTDLERQLEGNVSRALAAELLGVSHTALNRWITSGDIPVVIRPDGRKMVSIPTLAELREAVDRERASGRRHALEPIVLEGHDRARVMNPRNLIADKAGDGDPRRATELRSLAYHRELARQLRRPMADDALNLVRQWRNAGTIDPRYADEWEDLLRKPIPEIRKVMREDTQHARDLRQNSPFAGLLSEQERRKIVTDIR